MELYCVFGVEYHVGHDLLGIYDSYELALKAKTEVEGDGRREYDAVVIKTFILNSDGR